MAYTGCQHECERWVRDTYLAQRYGQSFEKLKLRLGPGGEFEFDAVSADRRIAVTVSTGGAFTASGRRGVGKLMKLRADILLLLMADVRQRLVVLTERDMYELGLREQGRGRVPAAIEFVHAPLPDDLREQLTRSRRTASDEVSPVPRVLLAAAAVDVEEQVRRATPPNAVLLGLAASRQPPASWWADGADPFDSEAGV